MTKKPITDDERRKWMALDLAMSEHRLGVRGITNTVDHKPAQTTDSGANRDVGNGPVPGGTK